MFFILAKLFEFFCRPSHLLIWLTLTAAFLLLLKHWRWGTRLCVLAAACAALFGFTPLGRVLLRPLEDTYPRPVLPPHIDGIVVLGGGERSDIWQSRGAPGADVSALRIVSAYILAEHHPEAKLVFSGGWPPMPESIAARQLLDELGFDMRRLTVESQSRDTWENLEFTRRLMKPKPGEVWVLATSANHLPRAMGIARALHWKMLPWPTDYDTANGGYHGWMRVVINLDAMDTAFSEWVGMLAYRISGRWAPR